jgi:uncharacterized phage protein (TIGR01671 family)
MREIKFRAWDKRLRPDTGKGKMYQVTALLSYGVDVDEAIDEDGNITLYDTYELMQYTGLKDKNGNEIYEGDILQDRYEIKGKPEIDTGRIDFINGCTCLTYFDLDEDGQRQYFPAYNGLEHYEVIGNLYENPELLEEK